MASSPSSLFILCSFLFISCAIARTSFRPKALVLPVSKDPSTLQHIITINQRTPLVHVSVTLDLGGQFLWVDCEQGYVSSTRRPTRCGSAQCSLAKSSACSGVNTCVLFPENTVTPTATAGDLVSDVVSVQSTDGKTPGRNASVSQFLFTCGATFLLEGLASGVKGMAGLGRTRISLPSQFSAAFSFDRKFALCLSSSTESDGVLFFGDGPYEFLPDLDALSILAYTPLITNPVSTAAVSGPGEPSAEYFIGVRGVRVSGNPIPINTTLLSINREGIGGTKFSTVTPYTVLETSIYNAIVDAFTQELSYNYIERVATVAPFGACYNSKNITYDALGPYVPLIDLVLQKDTVIYQFVGANSMVKVSDDVMCLGFVDGGLNPRTSIVIGAYQLQDNLLQFDLATSRLGFSYSLLARQTNCSNFNFTPTRA